MCSVIKPIKDNLSNAPVIVYILVLKIDFYSKKYQFNFRGCNKAKPLASQFPRDDMLGSAICVSL